MLKQLGKQSIARRFTLNQLVNASTQQFLLLNGLRKGMNVLDIGCGIGAMSCWLAGQVGNEGMVLAIDSNEVQLEIARELAAEHNITNIEFAKLTSDEIDQIKTRFDMVYSRFLLIHLQDPTRLINAIYDHLEPGGVFACESAILGHEFCFPHEHAFERWRELNYEMFKCLDKDPQTGKKLYSMMTQAGFHDINARIFQPVLTTQEQREELLVQDMQEQAEEFCKHNLCTAAEVEQLVKDLAELSKDDSHFIAYCQSCQVAGIK